jgi:hypothetical protein
MDQWPSVMGARSFFQDVNRSRRLAMNCGFYEQGFDAAQRSKKKVVES